jgi:hypothetical protein
MGNRIGFGLILLVLQVPPTDLGRQNSQSSIPNSTKGFDKQYQNLFKAFEKAENPSKAYKEENGQAVLERLHTFAIPEDWFTQTFGPEEGPKLAKHYSELFQAFERSTIGEFRNVLGELSAQVHTSARGAYQPNAPKSAQSSFAPFPAVQLFRIQHFTAPLASSDGTLNGRPYNFAWAEYFIYLDGAFRFAGSYNCSFWMPCSTNDPVFRGQLIQQVHPGNRDTSKISPD